MVVMNAARHRRCAMVMLIMERKTIDEICSDARAPSFRGRRKQHVPERTIFILFGRNVMPISISLRDLPCSFPCFARTCIDTSTVVHLQSLANGICRSVWSNQRITAAYPIQTLYSRILLNGTVFEIIKFLNERCEEHKHCLNEWRQE